MGARPRGPCRASPSGSLWEETLFPSRQSRLEVAEQQGSQTLKVAFAAQSCCPTENGETRERAFVFLCSKSWVDSER